MPVDFNTALEELVEKKVMEFVPVLLYKKTRFTPEDIAELYGIHKDVARNKMNEGQFGEVIEITKRKKVVTLEGLLEYETKAQRLYQRKTGAEGPCQKKESDCRSDMKGSEAK